MDNLVLTTINQNELISIIKSSLRETLKETKLIEQEVKHEPEPYLTRDEVSKLLKVSLVSLHKYVKERRIKAHKIGRRVLFKRSEVERALQSNKKDV